jgi:hypothetical protein
MHVVYPFKSSFSHPTSALVRGMSITLHMCLAMLHPNFHQQLAQYLFNSHEVMIGKAVRLLLCRLNLDLCSIKGTPTLTQTPTAWSSSVYAMMSSQTSVRKQLDKEGHMW